MSTTELSITFKTRLLDRREVAEQTTALLFEKPPDWTFRPGQFVDLTVLNPPETDAEGNTRGFSVASAPEEGHLMFRHPDARHGLQTRAWIDAHRHGSEDRRTIWQSDVAQ